MPIYEYTCGECERRFERLVLTPSSMSPEQITCRHCGSTRVVRDLSTFSARSGSSPGRGPKPAPVPGGGGGGCGRPGGCGCH